MSRIGHVGGGGWGAYKGWRWPSVGSKWFFTAPALASRRKCYAVCPVFVQCLSIICELIIILKKRKKLAILFFLSSHLTSSSTGGFTCWPSCWALEAPFSLGCKCQSSPLLQWYNLYLWVQPRLHQRCNVSPQQSLVSQTSSTAACSPLTHSTQHVQDFVNRTWMCRYGVPVASSTKQLIWSFMLAVLSLGAWAGALHSGTLPVTYGRWDKQRQPGLTPAAVMFHRAANYCQFTQQLHADNLFSSSKHHCPSK